MTNYGANLEQTFHALADPTRRKVIERLSLGPASVTELAEPFDMALPTFLQHLKVLEASQLVRSEKVGRVRTFRIQADQIAGARQWMNDQLELWERRLDQLDNYAVKLMLQQQQQQKEGHNEQDR